MQLQRRKMPSKVHCQATHIQMTTKAAENKEKNTQTKI